MDISGEYRSTVNTPPNVTVTDNMEAREPERSNESTPVTSAPASQQERLTDLLRAYGYKPTSANIEMLNLMLENALPLTKENVARMNQALKLMDTPEKALFMMVNDIRLTQAHAAQLNGLVDGRINITGQLNELMTALLELNDPVLREQLLNILTRVGNTEAPSGAGMALTAGADNAAAAPTVVNGANSVIATLFQGNGNNPAAISSPGNGDSPVAAAPTPGNGDSPVTTAPTLGNGNNLTTTAQPPSNGGNPVANPTAPATASTSVPANNAAAAPSPANGNNPVAASSSTNVNSAAVAPTVVNLNDLAVAPASDNTNSAADAPSSANKDNSANISNTTTLADKSAESRLDPRSQTMARPENTLGTENEAIKTAADLGRGSRSTVPTEEASLSKEATLIKEVVLQDKTDGEAKDILSAHLSETIAANEKQTVRAQLSFRWTENAPEDIDRFINSLRDALRQAGEALSDSRSTQSPMTEKIMQRINALSEHIDFVTQIKNQWYVQLPVVVDRQEMNTALYVYKDSQKKKEKGDGTYSALIALDTAGLGHFETYVQKRSQSVVCQFRLRDKAVEQLVRKHIHKLDALLRSCHYSLDAFSFLPPSEPYSVLDSPGQFTGNTGKNGEPGENGEERNYLFDSRV